MDGSTKKKIACKVEVVRQKEGEITGGELHAGMKSLLDPSCETRRIQLNGITSLPLETMSMLINIKKKSYENTSVACSSNSKRSKLH